MEPPSHHPIFRRLPPWLKSWMQPHNWSACFTSKPELPSYADWEFLTHGKHGVINVDFNFKLLNFGAICYTALTNTIPQGLHRGFFLFLEYFPLLFLGLSLIQDAEGYKVVWKWKSEIHVVLVKAGTVRDNSMHMGPYIFQWKARENCLLLLLAFLNYLPLIAAWEHLKQWT